MIRWSAAACRHRQGAAPLRLPGSDRRSELIPNDGKPGGGRGQTDVRLA
jgi:hypothetical protein